MRTKDFAFVGAKIVGIILFIKGINLLVTAIDMWVMFSSPHLSSISSSIAIFYILLLAIFILGMGLFLWGFTGKILRFLVPKDNNRHEDTADRKKVDLYNLQTAAFTVVGLVILSDAIPKIFHAAAEILRNKDYYFPISTPEGFNPLSIQLLAKILGPLIYLFIGIYLVFGFKNFLSIIGKGVSKLRRDVDPGDDNMEDAGDAHEKPGAEG